ncbi:MAG: hypothetical protein IT249_14795 [Chitinophagaceae bacterium]|nr:hypothetical protein [Chitinophagaceae bacterium]
MLYYIEISKPYMDINTNKIRNVLLDAMCLIIIAEIISVLASNQFSWKVTIVTILAVAAFALLAVIAKKAPYSSLLSALVVFIILSIVSAAIKPTYLGGSIIVKIFILIYLVRAIHDARELSKALKTSSAL